MKRFLVAAFACAIVCSAATAQAVILPDSYRSTGAHVGLAPFALSDDSDGIRPVVDMPGIGLPPNGGRCTLFPPDRDLIRRSGPYYYEFCDHPTRPNHVWVDVHRADGPGLGQVVQTLVLSCAEHGAFFPPKAFRLFCND